MIRTHFDLAPVALLLGALVLLLGARPRAAMAVLGLGAMTKGFPLLAAPVALAWLVRRGERRAAVQGAAVLALVAGVLAAAALVLSPAGAVDAVRYQLERPVQVESTPALVLVGLDGLGLGEAEAVESHRSNGLEHPAAAAVTGGGVALGLAALTLLALLAARARTARALLLAALGSVCAGMLFGKVLSPQFLIWTLPLGALALAWREHALAAAVGCATLLTLVEFPAHYLDVVEREPWALALVGARNATLALALALVFRSLRREQDLLDAAGEAVVSDLDQDPVQPGVLVRGLEADREHAAKALQGLLAPDADDTPARARHADVADVGRPPG
jgi:hypothetical protein